MPSLSPTDEPVVRWRGTASVCQGMLRIAETPCSTWLPSSPITTPRVERGYKILVHFARARALEAATHACTVRARRGLPRPRLTLGYRSAEQYVSK